jgi:hypothetical protein
MSAAASVLDRFLAGTDAEGAALVIALDTAIRRAHSGFDVAINAAEILGRARATGGRARRDKTAGYQTAQDREPEGRAPETGRGHAGGRTAPGGPWLGGTWPGGPRPASSGPGTRQLGPCGRADRGRSGPWPTHGRTGHQTAGSA